MPRYMNSVPETDVQFWRPPPLQQLPRPWGQWGILKRFHLGLVNLQNLATAVSRPGGQLQRDISRMIKNAWTMGRHLAASRRRWNLVLGLDLSGCSPGDSCSKEKRVNAIFCSCVRNTLLAKIKKRDNTEDRTPGHVCPYSRCDLCLLCKRISYSANVIVSRGHIHNFVHSTQNMEWTTFPQCSMWFSVSLCNIPTVKFGENKR